MDKQTFIKHQIKQRKNERKNQSSISKITNSGSNDNNRLSNNQVQYQLDITPIGEQQIIRLKPITFKI